MNDPFNGNTLLVHERLLEYEREAGEADDKVVGLIEHAAARPPARLVLVAPDRQRQRRDEAAVAGRPWVDQARRAPRRASP